MTTIVLLALTGLGLGALYFLVASGLSLIFGLMRVLNFAHGAFLTLGAYLGWVVAQHVAGGSNAQFLLSLVAGTLTGATVAVATELLLIRPLYRREIDQVLVTVGLALMVVALVSGLWGSTAKPTAAPRWVGSVTSLAGARIPNDRWLVIGAASVVLAGLLVFLRRTRYGLIVRAGVENRAMVTALGIDVRRAFTVVFAIGGAAAGLGGVLAGEYFHSISPSLGGSVLIYAFIVVVIGGLGSVVGSAAAAVLVGLLQQFANYYAASGVGDLSVVLLLAVVLLTRPQGLLGRPA
ncbi:MAG TPA: branched-chain amino acid ABC transporter permease [Actinomycetes bacterium]|nr:branched-chain amino acid ABC transporter permease [Actinomycetes bacterium]